MITHKSYEHMLDSYIRRGVSNATACAWWRVFADNVRTAKQAHPERVRVVSYERIFLERDNEEAARLFAFLGLGWNASWLSGAGVRRERCSLCNPRFSQHTYS